MGHDAYHNAIFVHDKKQMPKGEHWAIIKYGRIHIPGDERSRTNPGHGYPAHDEPNIEYRAYLDRADWEAAVSELITEKASESWTAMRVNPVSAKIKVELEIAEDKATPAQLKKRLECRYSKPWVGPCGVRTIGGEEFCSEHLQEKCRCGKQAVRGCDNAGQFVCGAPLCENCYCNH